jgi:hypothetical protein
MRKEYERRFGGVLGGPLTNDLSLFHARATVSLPEWPSPHTVRKLAPLSLKHNEVECLFYARLASTWNDGTDLCQLQRRDGLNGRLQCLFWHSICFKGVIC